jgi:L-serine dehydratase
MAISAMLFTATDDQGDCILQRTYYSIGGGFVLGEDADGAPRIEADPTPVPYPFDTGAERCAVTARTMCRWTRRSRPSARPARI